MSVKGTSVIQREFHRVDAVSLRTEHYSSYGKIADITAVEGKVPLGAPVVLIQNGGKKVPGRYRGLRKDAEGELLPGSQPLYSLAEK